MLFALIVLAYLLGSISTAIITCQLMGLPDPRTDGSKNPGATNVLRIGGKKAAMITLIGDMLKGLVPVLIGRWLGFEGFELFLIGFAAFFGHLYPLYYGFKGGKGVATALGIYAGLNLWAGLIVAATWLFVAKVLKISSLAALVATALAPFYFYVFTHDGRLFSGLIVVTLLIFWRHQSNIRNLLNGKESLIKTKS
ncbi:glycerol-3-phosphate 1-O-acyltransferase PlsY [Thiolinea disciformis]|uniref:glycerol-3-phosphate 1-O-acyltransferase PlsY n=1 Tax=Thiolinea disciformis TaxID=125614 RepID=UPI00035FECE0|nr:glycerol-3-phosphate 1-O-acyltransferase PlsY [Thiolinea disciformis]